MSQDLDNKTPRNNLQSEDKASSSPELAASEVWYVASNGFHSGPYELENLANRIKSKEFGRNISLWTPGLKSWVRLHDVQPLIQLLGLAARRHERVPFTGHLKVSDSLSAMIKDLSVGGLGIEGLSLVEGTVLKVRVHSDLLPIPLHARAKVVHVSGPRSGLQFVDLSPTDVEMIQDYINLHNSKNLTE